MTKELPTLSEIIINKCPYTKLIAEFKEYRDGELWYNVVRRTELLDNIIFTFPIPIKDTGTGIFTKQAKPVELMRWIRKYLEVQKGWS